MGCSGGGGLAGASRGVDEFGNRGRGEVDCDNDEGGGANRDENGEFGDGGRSSVEGRSEGGSGMRG